ncbi:hypothetical protein N8940_00735 [Sphingomonadaceae bacterium]|nr:hypothetical protein [Sphingomonadaceae bacterium]
MPITSNAEIMSLFQDFNEMLDQEKSQIIEPSELDPNPNFHWQGGWNSYRAFDDRRYFASPPCLGSPLKDKDREFTALCFYYLKFDESGELTCHYYVEENRDESDEPKPYSDPYLSLDTFVKDKTKDAQSGNPNSQSRDLDGQKWNEPSMVAVYLDNKGWDLMDITLPNGNSASFSFHFHDIKVRRERDDRHAHRDVKHRNWSFFNARNHDLGGGSRYLSVQNHHNKAHYRGPRRDNPQYEDAYKFDIFYKVKLAGSEDKSIIVIVDPGGRNTGPGEP